MNYVILVLEVNVSTAGDEMEFEEDVGEVLFEYFFSGVDSIADNVIVVVNVTVDTMDAQLLDNGMIQLSPSTPPSPQGWYTVSTVLTITTKYNSQSTRTINTLHYQPGPCHFCYSTSYHLKHLHFCPSFLS